MTETRRIPQLKSYLKQTREDQIIIRTSLVSGGWHDNEFDAHAAGFEISRFQNPKYIARHEYAECYLLTRRF